MFAAAHEGEQRLRAPLSAAGDLHRDGERILQLVLRQACVRDDIDTYGVSYWRRAHQMPGVFWCSDHQIPLAWVAREAYFSTPESVLNVSDAKAFPWLDTLHGRADVERFLSLCSSVVADERPLNYERVVKIVQARLPKLGEAVGKGVARRRYLPDRVCDQFDARWLGTVFAAVERKRSHQVWKLLYRVFAGKPQFNTVGCLLIMAVLFDSAEEAVAAMSGAQEHRVREAPTPSNI